MTQLTFEQLLGLATILVMVALVFYYVIFLIMLIIEKLKEVNDENSIDQ